MSSESQESKKNTPSDTKNVSQKKNKIWTSSSSFEAIPPIDFKDGRINLAFTTSSRSIYPIDPKNKTSSTSVHSKHIHHTTPKALAESSHHSYPKIAPPRIRRHKKEKKPNLFVRIIRNHPKRYFCFKLTVAFLIIIFLLLIGFLVLASIKPCLFTKCHKKSSLCIDRFPFWAQCICDIGYSGNGKTYCSECGKTSIQSNILRVVGGSESVKFSWPFAAYIVQNYQGRFNIKGSSYLISYSWSCGGTILNQRTILTAAHCIHDKNFEYEDNQGNFYTLTMQWNQWFSNLESTFEVYVGAHDLRFLNESKKYLVKRVNKHEDFDEFTLQNDVATLQLTENIDKTVDTQYACLPNAESITYPKSNQEGYIVGWGKTSEKGSSSNVQKNAKIQIYQETECSKVEANIPKNWDSQICAGTLDGTIDTCQGDSGGGLFVHEKSNSSQYFVYGIVSYGDGCARLGKPGIYSRTSYFLDWIRKYSDF